MAPASRFACLGHLCERKMNEVQRQLLADRIDETSRRLERYDTDIAKLDVQLARKRAARKATAEELAQLKEGIDW